MPKKFSRTLLSGVLAVAVVTGIGWYGIHFKAKREEEAKRAEMARVQSLTARLRDLDSEIQQQARSELFEAIDREGTNSLAFREGVRTLIVHIAAESTSTGRWPWLDAEKALIVILKCYPIDMVPVIESCLSDENAFVRQLAVFYIWHVYQHQNPEYAQAALPIVRKALADKEERVVENARRWCKDSGPIFALLANVDPEVFLTVLGSIEAGDPSWVHSAQGKAAISRRELLRDESVKSGR